MLFFQFGDPGSGGFQFGFQIGDRFLLFGEVTGYDQRLRNEVAGPSLVLLFAFLVLLKNAIGYRTSSSITEPDLVGANAKERWFRFAQDYRRARSF